MLVTCPHCSKKIGEGQSECPLCKAEFSKNDMMKMSAEKSDVFRNEQKEKFQRLQVFRKKHKRFLVALLISYILMFACIPLTITLATTKLFILSFVPALALPVVLIAGIVTGAARCPFCGAILMRQHGEYCSRCGERIF